MPLQSASFKSPGLYITEATAGTQTFTVAAFNQVYVFGTGDKVGATKNQLTQVTSLTDFIAQHGYGPGGATSPLNMAIKSFFFNVPRALLQFVNVTCVAAGLPTAVEYQTAMDAVFGFPTEITPGFMCFPQTALPTAQNSINTTPLRKQVYDYAISKAQLIRGVVLADAFGGADLKVGLSAAQAQAEGTAFIAPLGHIAYYWPHLADDVLTAGGVNVWPPSLSVAAVAFQKYRDFGLQEAPAGVQYPVLGAYQPVVKVDAAVQDILNPLSINVIRSLPNYGVVVWGARVRSSQAGMRFVNERVGLCVIEKTVENSFSEFIFRTNDGVGITMMRLRTSLERLLEVFRSGGVLYGGSPKDAYQVIVDGTNNLPAGLADGFVVADIYVALSPPIERLVANFLKVDIGQVQISAAQGIR